MKFETLQFQLDGAIGRLSINRPQALNALNMQVLKELSEFIHGLKSFPDLRALIITGAGEKAFVAGADIKEMQARDPKTGGDMAREGQKVFQSIEDLKIPTIAAVNGFALGGGLELALSCDFIIASKTAKLGLPEVSLGLIPGYGGTQRLARLAGKAVARLMTLTGEIFSAEQCEKWGVIAMTTEPAELLPTVEKFAKKISERSPRAIELAKQAIARGVDVSQYEGLKIEAELFHTAFNSKDRVEGVDAFVNKRPAKFTGQ